MHRSPDQVLKSHFKPLSEIIGQERAIRFLKQVMAQGKIPHAYLFAGITGIGKTTTALSLIQVINCHEPVNGEACGRCPSCRQIKGGNFPDFLYIGPDIQNIKIEQIRDLNRALTYRPLAGRYRLSLIHNAETMTDEAANAFLKTLEEPPQNNILILSVTEPLALLPTIASRCQTVLFRPISARVIADWLRDKRGMDKELAFVVARVSEGSLGRAIRLCDGDFLEKRQEYLLLLLQLPGLSPEEVLETALELTRKTKRKDLVGFEEGDGTLLDVLNVWKTWYRDLILLKADCPTDMLINVDFSHKLKKASKNARITHLMDSLLIIDQAQRDLLRGRNVDLTMENMFLSLRGLAWPKSEG